MQNLIFSSRLLACGLLCCLAFLPCLIHGQSIGIGTATPDPSAILDIQSATQGILVPRMTSLERNSMPIAADGLLVFDTDTKTFWYFANSMWNNISAAYPNRIVDTDGDTQIQVEEFPDEDKIHFDLAGFEHMSLVRNAAGIPRLSFYDLEYDEHVAIGHNAMLNTTAISTRNTAVGSKTLEMNQNGSYNTALGWRVLQNNEGGSYNTAIGQSAMWANKGSGYNTAVGAEAMGLTYDGTNTVYSYNTALGYSALHGNAPASGNTGVRNTALGANALHSASSGSKNVAVGNNALFENLAGTSNIAIGFEALKANVGNNRSIAIGEHAMEYADDRAAGQTTSNIAIGHDALRGSTTPANNTGVFNTAVGDQAMRVVTTGSNNVGLGAMVMLANTTGSANTGSGYLSLTDNTVGTHNTAYGYLSLDDNTTGIGNTGIGATSLNQNTTGNFNTALGRSAYFTSSGLNNTTCIGYLSGAQSNVSNRIEIGNSSVTWIGGQVTWGTYSDARIKRNVRENVPGLDFITRLRPVTYNLDIHTQNDMTLRGKEGVAEWPEKYDIEQKQMTGFIAQEVEAAAQSAGYDFSGVEQAADEVGLYSIRYAEFVVPLVKAVQEQQSLIAAQQLRLDDQEATIAWLKTRADEAANLAAELNRLHARFEQLTRQQTTPPSPGL